jgi:hypothetical protein
MTKKKAAITAEMARNALRRWGRRGNAMWKRMIALGIALGFISLARWSCSRTI